MLVERSFTVFVVLGGMSLYGGAFSSRKATLTFLGPVSEQSELFLLHT